MSTDSWAAWIALRIRVRKSAMGSVLALTGSLCCWRLPRRFRHAREEAVVGHLTQADPAQAELAVVRPRPAATPTSTVLPGLDLRGARLTHPLGRLGYVSCLHLRSRSRPRTPRRVARRPPGSPA